MKRALFFVYGLLSYFLFFGTILYMIGFVEGILVPKTINSGEVGSTFSSILINISIVMLFGVQHTIMARIAFKKEWTKTIPRPIERSTFVAIASGILILLMWQWRPLPAEIWKVDSAIGQGLLYSISGIGWVIVFVSTFLINHFDLFGLRQIYFCLVNKEYKPVKLKVASLYRFVRHPLMLGFLLAFWATPTAIKLSFFYTGGRGERGVGI